MQHTDRLSSIKNTVLIPFSTRHAYENQTAHFGKISLTEQ